MNELRPEEGDLEGVVEHQGQTVRINISLALSGKNKEGFSYYRVESTTGCPLRHVTRMGSATQRPPMQIKEIFLVFPSGDMDTTVAEETVFFVRLEGSPSGDLTRITLEQLREDNPGINIDIEWCPYNPVKKQRVRERTSVIVIRCIIVAAIAFIITESGMTLARKLRKDLGDNIEQVEPSREKQPENTR
jgi:hypothetical protein